MNFVRNLGGALLLSVLAASPAYAEATVTVTLIDKIGTGDTSGHAMLGMGMEGDMSSAKMGININRKSVPRGAVRFNVTNLASNLVHEVLVARLGDETKKLAYDESKSMADEDMLLTLGSVAEIEPRKSASLTLDLKPGKYILYCNLPGHYMAGMWTLIEVN